MNRREYLGTVAGVAVASAGCLHGDDDDGIEESDWHTVRGDPARSGITTAEAGPGESLSVAWKRSDSDLIRELEGGEYQFPPGGEFTQPVLYDDYCIYTFKFRAFPENADVLDKVYVIALSQADGSLVWTQEFLDGLEAQNYHNSSSPDVANGSVYLQSPASVEEPFIDVLDADSGEYTGRIELDWQLRGSVLHDGILYAVDLGPGYTAIDLEDGSTLWRHDVSTTGGSPGLMALSSDTVVYTGSSYLAARDIETGELEWETSDLFGGPVMLGEDRGYLATQPGQEQSLTAFDLSDGTIEWEFTPDGFSLDDGSGETLHFVYGVPVVRDDLVLTTASGERMESETIGWYLYALDREDGTEQWSVRLGGRHASAPVVAGETIYARTKAISMDGMELDSVDSEDRLSGHPAVGNGRIYSEGRSDTDYHRLVALE